MKTKRIMTLLVVALIGATTMMFAKELKTVTFKVEQMECGNCEKKVKENIRFEKGVKEFATDLATRTVSITYDADKTNVEKLVKGFKKFNYEAQCVEPTSSDCSKAKGCCSKADSCKDTK